MSSDELLFPIVGIGASAGGIHAIEALFRTVPKATGLGFVVITHLSPHHESLLHEIVQRCTEMPVFVIEHDMAVEPDCVYVMPQNTILTLESGRFAMRRPDPVHRERNPIDLFLASLAQDRGEYAIGIVLSGGGGDGTLGIKSIKERGGLTLAQTADGTSPAHSDMPGSAIATGLVDHPVPVQEMASKIVAYRQSMLVSPQPSGLPAHEPEDATLNRKAVYEALRKQTGHDFSGYKTNTFMRRIHRRMQILQIVDVATYIARLEADRDELGQLFRDLLINVTNFFRDQDAFEALEKTVIPRLFEGRGADDTVRVWVPGCATGEEVFSIGILLREHMDTLRHVPRVQIFATDIDDPALLVARAARYPALLLDSVSPERRRRFFVEDGGTYVVTKAVRDLCIFSPHSIIRDPPFSRIDLVSCRNLLIYFGAEIQNQVVPIFHYALKPGGYLFLGTSENIGHFGDLFASADKKQRIFQARDHGAAKRLPVIIYGPRNAPFLETHLPSPNNIPLRHLVEARVVDRHAPAYAVVNAEGDIVYCSQRTGKYLEIPQGPPNRQLLAMARRGLRLDLRNALQDVVSSGQTSSRTNVVIDDDDDDAIHLVKLTVDVLPDRTGEERLFLVLFEDVGPPVMRDHPPLEQRGPGDGAVASLERDLRDSRERLQSMIEEYETALEELKSSNEELVSVNEELQSTNEELEASKEELQSLNEELHTVNLELTNKLDDLDHANSDLKNLFESTQIATVFLDRDLVIRSFTPAASRIFRIIPSDRGRPLTDLSVQSSYPQLEAHVRQVFDTGNDLEHRIAAQPDDGRYLVRLIPYRNMEEGIEGVVVTFVDITTLARSEEQQDVLIAELNHRVKNMLAVAISIVRQMKKQALPTDQFCEALIGRLHAMADAYELIARDNWNAVSLDEIVAKELARFSASRFTVSGPPIRLKPKAGLSMGMVIHELATNAARHGALAGDAGRLAVTWTVDGARLAITWSEEGDSGPVTGPITPSFGLRLVEREIKFGLDGSIAIDLGDKGLTVAWSFLC